MSQIKVKAEGTTENIPVKRMLGVMVSTDLANWVKQYAESRELSLSDVVRIALIEYKEKHDGRDR